MYRRIFSFSIEGWVVAIALEWISRENETKKDENGASI